MIADDEVGIEASGISAGIDLRVGHVCRLAIASGERILSPLHAAPWRDQPDAAFPEATPPNVRRLAGDFFCAPFGRNDVVEGPSHGLPANSRWSVERRTAHSVTLKLDASVMGAVLRKTVRVRDDHPFLYQEHVFTGGAGAISFAHHTMTRIAGRARLSFSPKRFAETLPAPLEPDPARGRSIFSYPARSEDPSRIALAAQGHADLTRYPVGDRHEDFVLLAEDRGAGSGWTVVGRHEEEDAIIVLKDASTLPVTMLWYSNGGRDYAPWSGRHAGVIGIEDGCCHPTGHSASLAPNSLTREGIMTARELRSDGSVVVRQVIGGFAVPDAARPVAAVEPKAGSVAIRYEDGQTISLPFDDAFLAAGISRQAG